MHCINSIPVGEGTDKGRKVKGLGLQQYVCMYVCMYVCVYVCMYVYIYMVISMDQPGDVVANPSRGQLNREALRITMTYYF